MGGKGKAEEVEARVIEPGDRETLVVACSPASIEANFDALEAHVRSVVADYEGATYDLTSAQALRDATHDRRYLNGLKREIDERRKAVKREYTKPLDAFERRCKQVTEIIDEAADNIKAQLDEAEAARRDRAYAALSSHYAEFADLLAPVVPYERLHEAQWLNKSFGEAKARRALEEKVSAVARDWDTLKAQRDSMPHYAEAERELFRTLDLGAALTAARLADEEDARIAEMRAAMEPDGAADPDGAEAPMPAPSPAAGLTPAPAPCPQPAPAPCPQPAPAPCPQPEPSCPWTVVIPSATRSQMKALAETLRAQGITGTIRKG